MTGELRSRSPSETLALSMAAAAAAGITRVSHITAFGVPGIPVCQAIRPAARSLTVSMGKGLTNTSAVLGALLEGIEASSAEELPRPPSKRPLAGFCASHVTVWSGPRDPLAIDLDPTRPRAWLPGNDLLSGRPCPMPWDLLSLDYTQERHDYPATSSGLACGNSRTEALVSGLGELLERHSMAHFARLTPRQKLAGQIALSTLDDQGIQSLLRRVERAGFLVKAWSLANEAGLAAIQCTLFRKDRCLDDLPPVSGTGCYPIARVAFLRALLEAVQTRAGIVAGARDDLAPQDYGNGGEREAAFMFSALAFGEGPLDWRHVPNAECPSREHCLDFLLSKAEQISDRPIIAFDHASPAPGLHLAHVLGPGLMDLARKPEKAQGLPERPRTLHLSSRRRVAGGERAILFAGPSIAGLPLPEELELRPPARCGDLAALLFDPPAAVGLIDGYFKIAPTVWHKEIMALLAAGTRVIGGASLGAIRAAELDRFGMEGVGVIFHLYRTGMLVRDDAVMLVHAPTELGYAPLSLPLVDAEYALRMCDLPPPALRMMQRILRTTPFEIRSWPGCLAAYRMRAGADFPLLAEALEAAPSLKRMDAKLVIENLVSERITTPVARHPVLPFTDHFRALLARTASASGAAAG